MPLLQLLRCPPRLSHVQREPAARRAAARADRRANAPGRPRGELLVPAPSRRLRMDRRAGTRAAGRRSRLRRGLRRRRPRPDAPPRWWGWTPTRRPTSTPGCATGAETCASSAAWWRSSTGPATRSSSCRRSSTSHDPGAAAGALRRRRAAQLHHDAEPADARPARRPEVRQPLAPARVHPGRVPRAPGAALLARRDARRLPRGEAAHPRAGAHGSAGTGSTARFASRSRSTTASCRRSRPPTSSSPPDDDLDRALDFVAVCHA